MKTGIHPQYNNKVTAKCVCGATYDIGSTQDEMNTEICSACHPFYTGKRTILDTAGRVDKFRAKMAKAEAKKAKPVASDDELTENTEAPAELVEKAPKAKKAAPKKKASTKK